MILCGARNTLKLGLVVCCYLHSTFVLFFVCVLAGFYFILFFLCSGYFFRENIMILLDCYYKSKHFKWCKLAKLFYFSFAHSKTFTNAHFFTLLFTVCVMRQRILSRGGEMWCYSFVIIALAQHKVFVVVAFLLRKELTSGHPAILG